MDNFLYWLAQIARKRLLVFPPHRTGLVVYICQVMCHTSNLDHMMSASFSFGTCAEKTCLNNSIFNRSLLFYKGKVLWINLDIYKYILSSAGQLCESCYVKVNFDPRAMIQFLKRLQYPNILYSANFFVGF